MILLGLCGLAMAQEPVEPLVIGSKGFTESRLLSEIMAQLVENRLDIPVERRLGLGGTTVVFTALTAGEIDLYAEYTGTAWAVLLGIEEPIGSPLETYATSASRFQTEHDLLLLEPFGFNNTYAMAMRGDLAEELGVTRVSELGQHAGDLTAGVSFEFLNREDGWPGLADAYELDMEDVRGMEHGLAYEAIVSGDIDLIDAYSTDGKLLKYNVRVLQDDLSYFPPYDAAPLIRADALGAHPELREVLSGLAFALTDQEMQTLNGEVEVGGESFEAVAQRFLLAQGLITDEPGLDLERGTDRNQEGFLAFMAARVDVTAKLVVEHLGLTAAAMFLGIFLSVPLGIAITRYPRLRPALTVAGILQTVPSLALLALLIPLMGLGVWSAITALFLYTILPILRNTVTGVEEVDPDLIEAARAMGLTDNQLLTRVQLPLASPTIMAGVRTATVISVGVATLAAFIGAGGLGEPIVTGLQLNDTRLILSGALPAAALAVLVDVGLGQLERAVTPRGMKKS